MASCSEASPASGTLNVTEIVALPDPYTLPKDPKPMKRSESSTRPSPAPVRPASVDGSLITKAVELVNVVEY